MHPTNVPQKPIFIVTHYAWTWNQAAFYKLGLYVERFYNYHVTDVEARFVLRKMLGTWFGSVVT